jgi:hypothetical protein
MGSIATQKTYEIEPRPYINGEFVPFISGKKFDVYNPSTERSASGQATPTGRLHPQAASAIEGPRSHIGLFAVGFLGIFS